MAEILRKLNGFDRKWFDDEHAAAAPGLAMIVLATVRGQDEPALCPAFSGQRNSPAECN
ncbi:MAG: hypothetical protein ACSLE7_12850 [Mycobacterium sp.]